ncbi:MAG: cobalt-precorrin-5B (C(1))-methyltransferase CbiD [Cyanobacteria bacterium P01_E01_bin.6]
MSSEIKHSQPLLNQPTDSPQHPPRTGYTLPVFACASAIAALQQLNTTDPTFSLESVHVNLMTPAQTVDIAVEQHAPLDSASALAITRSDPGENLDITRNTPVWAKVTLRPFDSAAERIQIFGGEGIGKKIQQAGDAAIYRYATELLMVNLTPWLLPEQAIDVTIILPEGRTLATRTSNEAFGVVEGLSLLGTSGISQPLSAPGQLHLFRTELRQQSRKTDVLVFCIGENGLDLARTMGIGSQHLIKTANWLGPLLVEAGEMGVQSILLFGYHGKLIKLAGGIFHTHHHVADGRQEIFGAACVRAGLPTDVVQQMLDKPTVEEALADLRYRDVASGTHWVESVYGLLVDTIDRRSRKYIHTHSQKQVCVGTLVFDRQRTIIQTSQLGCSILKQVC